MKVCSKCRSLSYYNSHFGAHMCSMCKSTETDDSVNDEELLKLEREFLTKFLSLAGYDVFFDVMQATLRGTKGKFEVSLYLEVQE